MTIDTIRYRVIIAIVAIMTVSFVSAPGIAQVAIVEDINVGAGGTYEFRAGALGSAIYFNAYDGVHGEKNCGSATES